MTDQADAKKSKRVKQKVAAKQPVGAKAPATPEDMQELNQ